MGVKRRFEVMSLTIDGLSLITRTYCVFNCHINVEACSSIKSVKYLFKYVYKGHDWASIAFRESGQADKEGNIDEIKAYRDARWVTPPEALWRIYGFDISKNYPPVQQL